MKRVEIGLMNLGMLHDYKNKGLLRVTPLVECLSEVSSAQLQYHLDRVLNKIELASRRVR